MLQMSVVTWLASGARGRDGADAGRGGSGPFLLVQPSGGRHCGEREGPSHISCPLLSSLSLHGAMLCRQRGGRRTERGAAERLDGCRKLRDLKRSGVP
jgi:hypothetical protein